MSEREQLVNEGLVSIPEAARFLGVGRTLIYLLLERGELPSAKVGKRRVIPRKALVALAAGRLTGGTAN